MSRSTASTTGAIMAGSAASESGSDSVSAPLSTLSRSWASNCTGVVIDPRATTRAHSPSCGGGKLQDLTPLPAQIEHHALATVGKHGSCLPVATLGEREIEAR